MILNGYPLYKGYQFSGCCGSSWLGDTKKITISQGIAMAKGHVGKEGVMKVTTRKHITCKAGEFTVGVRHVW